MPTLGWVCCGATADSCDVSCGAIVGASDFSVSFPVAIGGGVLPRGRGGPLRAKIRRPEKGGSSNLSSWRGSSNTSFPSKFPPSAPTLTCTPLPHRTLVRFPCLHPLTHPLS